MSNFDSLTNEQKLRATLHRDVNVLCEEICHLMGMDVRKSVTDVVGELIYKKLKVYATDMEAFAKHAKRSTINIDDVKLLARRNPSLKQYLSKIAVNSPTTKDKKRNTISSFVSKKKDLGSKVTENVTVAVIPTADDLEPMNLDETIDLTL